MPAPHFCVALDADGVRVRRGGHVGRNDRGSGRHGDEQDVDWPGVGTGQSGSVRRFREVWCVLLMVWIDFAAWSAELRLRDADSERRHLIHANDRDQAYDCGLGHPAGSSSCPGWVCLMLPLLVHAQKHHQVRKL
eukprot:2483653-Rhodomonas_salina.1